MTNRDHPTHMKYHFTFMLFSELLGRWAALDLNRNAFELNHIIDHVSNWFRHSDLIKS